MEFITFPVALTIVGSVGTICLTVYKLVSDKKKQLDPEILKHLKEFNDSRPNCAVRGEQIEELKRDVERLQTYLDKLNDMIFKLLSD